MKNFFLLIAVLFASLSSLSANNSMRAWVWANKPTTNYYVPVANYQFNSASNVAICIRRLGTGSYEVEVPGAGAHHKGVAHASAYGNSFTAQVVRWNADGNKLKIRVKTFNSTGQLQDGRFVLFFYKESRVSRRINSAYQWVNNPNNLSASYSFNSKGAANSVRKVGPGRYEVTFPRMTANAQSPGQLGNIQVTPYGGALRRAKVVYWNGHNTGSVRTIIQLYNADGQPADGQFVVSYISDFGLGQKTVSEDQDYGAYVWAGQPNTASYTPSLGYQDINTTAQNITIRKTGTGTYSVKLPKIISYKSTMAIVSAYGNGATYSSITGWSSDGSGNTLVTVRCYNASGSLTNAQFSLFYYTNQNILY